MNKKKRRKRSKADIREAWRKNHFKEQHEKEQHEKEQREKEQRPNAANQKNTPPPNPSLRKPWCSRCRAHTPYKMIYLTQRNGYGTPRTTRRIWYCLHCGERAWRPGDILGFVWAGVLGPPAVAILLVLLYDVLWTLRSLGLFLLFATLVTVALSYFVYQRVYPGYRDWKKWAKEQKVKESN